MTVLSVAFPLAPVSPDACGGAEQVLSMLDEGLVRRGHHSIVVATRGSATAGTLVAVDGPPGAFDSGARRAVQARYRAAIARAMSTWPVDVVHLHGVDFDAYLPPPGPPVLATLHLPPNWYSTNAMRPQRPDTWLNCVSRRQHLACPRLPNLLPPIENGIDVEALQAVHRKRHFVLYLGRICAEKGVHVAIHAAHRAGVPILIAGELFPYAQHRRYFAEQVRPHLGRTCRYLGSVGLMQKRRLLAAARCVLIPSAVPETSSLVAREAAACGTPAIAFPHGALNDTIVHGATGFLVDDLHGMVDAIRRATTISAAHCRETARARFSIDRMVDAYVARYRSLRRADLRDAS